MRVIMAILLALTTVLAGCFGGAEETIVAEEEVYPIWEEEKEEMGYATKEELAEVKSMIEEIKAMLEPKEDLSADELGNLVTEELCKHIQ